MQSKQKICFFILHFNPIILLVSIFSEQILQIKLFSGCLIKHAAIFFIILL